MRQLVSGPYTFADWNPRYVAYAVAHGRDPERMLAVDRRRGAVMTGFCRWISRQLRAFADVSPVAVRRGRLVADYTLRDHAAFDTWLGIEPSGNPGEFRPHPPTESADPSPSGRDH